MGIPKVSVGMPVYNGEGAVRAAIDSLLSQSFRDFELIVSDNASTDATAIICQEYAARDQRIRYVRQQENLGVASNFRFVLDKARGEYFMWAACDDYRRPEFIQKCLSVLKQDPRIAVAMTKYWVLSRKYAPLKMRHFPDMPFLTSEDIFTRVSQFMLMSDLTHKANLIYGLWRTPVVREMIEVFEDLADQFTYFGLDNAQLAYILVRWKAYQVPDVLFFKTYERVPPGYVTKVGRTLKQRLLKHKRWRERYEGNVRKHIEAVRIALARAGADDERYVKLVDLLQSRFLERYERPGGMLRELYRSIRAGLI